LSPVEVEILHRRGSGAAPLGPRYTCKKCGAQTDRDELRAMLSVCPACGYHARISARERLAQLTDPASFAEEWAHLRTLDPLEFVDLQPYADRVREAQAATGLTEAIVAGRARIDGVPCVLAVMDFGFMGGSMGSVVGEKLFRAAELAVAEDLPLVAICSSGGARMQEGILSLMQMAKTAMAADLLNESRVPYVTVLVDPCTGGVVASFATLADICIAEPGALLSFSGPRVIRETTREQLPESFGSAERNLELGHLDAVVPRAELRALLAAYLRLLKGGARDYATGPNGEERWLGTADLLAGAGDAGRRVIGGVRRRVRGARRMAQKATGRAEEVVRDTGRQSQ
jgi:acetyl-CoA carboxylase carboxyl transferase subunit beta